MLWRRGCSGVLVVWLCSGVVVWLWWCSGGGCGLCENSPFSASASRISVCLFLARSCKWLFIRTRERRHRQAARTVHLVYLCQGPSIEGRCLFWGKRRWGCFRELRAGNDGSKQASSSVIGSRLSPTNVCDRSGQCGSSYALAGVAPHARPIRLPRTPCPCAMFAPCRAVCGLASALFPVPYPSPNFSLLFRNFSLTPLLPQASASAHRLAIPSPRLHPAAPGCVAVATRSVYSSALRLLVLAGGSRLAARSPLVPS